MLREFKVAHDFSKGHCQINSLLFKYNIHFYTINRRQLEHLVHIFSNDVDIEFVIEKCAILIMKRRRFERSQRLELSNWLTLKTDEKEQEYKYSWII